MPRFFFHARNGDESSLDEEGDCLGSIADAEKEALLSIRDLVLEGVKNGEPVNGWAVEIADENGRILSRVGALQVLL
jgi:hypothetical protein